MMAEITPTNLGCTCQPAKTAAGMLHAPSCPRSERAPEAVAASGDDDLYLPCGHPASLKVSSVESDHWFCELCECRDERRDALTMEHALRAERDALAERLALEQMQHAATAQGKAEWHDIAATRAAEIGTLAERLAAVEREYELLRAALGDMTRKAAERESLVGKFDDDRDRLAAALAQREGELDSIAVSSVPGGSRITGKQAFDWVLNTLVERNREVATVRDETRRACAEELQAVSRSDLAGWIKQLDGLVRRWAPLAARGPTPPDGEG